MEAVSKPVVVRSIETTDGLRCIDIVRMSDGTFGWAEYRRDNEDPRGWRPTGIESRRVFHDCVAAEKSALGTIGWLAEVLGAS